MALKNKQELVKQIEAYGLKHKLAELARREESRRPFRHLPKQFSKGILIGNIAIVPKKYTGTRYVYVIADMLEAKILYEHISLKQSAILVAHHIAEGKSEPKNVIDYDTHFTSKLFEIQSSKAMIKAAEKERNDVQAEIYQQRLDDAHRLADEYKAKIQDIFHSTFEA
tara:strand:- start:36 stop:539 length:504 start_codon:yes stop_codon:yes gene_type:complete